MAALRAGTAAAVLGQRVAAPSTVGIFVRSFGWGQARQLDAVGRAMLRPDVTAWAVGRKEVGYQSRCEVTTDRDADAPSRREP